MQEFIQEIYYERLGTKFTRFHGGLFELDILEIFTQPFFLNLLFELEFLFSSTSRLGVWT